MYILSVIKATLGLLQGKWLRRYLFIQVFFVFSAIVQIVGIASVAPFIAVLSNPDIIQNNALFSLAYDYSGAADHKDFLVLFAIGSALLIFVANGVAALTQWVLLRFSVEFGGYLQSKLVETYLARDYQFHKSINHGVLISRIANEVPRFLYMVFQQFLILTGQLFIAVIILVGLLVIDFVVAVSAGGIVCGAYLITYVYLKRSLQRQGDVVTQRNSRVQSILAESFVGIKEIKLAGREISCAEQFSTVNKRGLNALAFISLAGELPRFVVETISFGALLGLAIALLGTRSSAEVFPILSLFALAGYKLLPTMQQIYKAISSLSANGDTAFLLKGEDYVKVSSDSYDEQQVVGEIQSIEILNGSFKYDSAKSWTLKDVSVGFEIGSVNTLVGASGSGKSTMIDILIGLLPLTSGSLRIDGEPLRDRSALRAYQRAIGYVPQTVFILDDTLFANIAMGIPEAERSEERALEALRMANALDILEKLPNGLDSPLGQDGKLLSGGQRQRIGIARALYRDSRVIVMDEPSSALDLESELLLMQVMQSIKDSVLVILVSHRPAAILNSDTVTLVADGNVARQQSIEDFKRENPGYGETAVNPS